MLRYLYKLKNKKGFTMIELLVAVAVFGILVTLMAALVGPISGLIMGARRDTRIDAIVDNIGDYIKKSTDIATRVEILDWQTLQLQTSIAPPGVADSRFKNIGEADMYLRNFSHCQYHIGEQFRCVILPCQNTTNRAYFCSSANPPHLEIDCDDITGGFCDGCPNTDHHVPCVFRTCPKTDRVEAARCSRENGYDTACASLNHCQDDPDEDNYCDDICKTTHCINVGVCPDHKSCDSTRTLSPIYDPPGVPDHPDIYTCESIKSTTHLSKHLLEATPDAEREYRIKGLYFDANGYLYDLGDITDELSGPTVTANDAYEYLIGTDGVLTDINSDPDGTHAMRTRVFEPDYYAPILCNEGIGYCEPYAPCENCGINYVISPLPSGGLNISIQAVRNVARTFNPYEPDNRTKVTKGRTTSFSFINPYLDEPVFNRGKENLGGDINIATNFLMRDPPDDPFDPTEKVKPQPILILYTAKD
ncbi:MAG: prepilin-type N-terminal cleavage/methylation domain-containing protein [Oscillospiraceae bacterium]|nr:prepilin-type N-terminal cleavage/methylation domain-containing protein [Oscillospiraceae bacterium]